MAVVAGGTTREVLLSGVSSKSPLRASIPIKPNSLEFSAPRGTLASRLGRHMSWIVALALAAGSLEARADMEDPRGTTVARVAPLGETPVAAPPVRLAAVAHEVPAAAAKDAPAETPRLMSAAERTQMGRKRRLSEVEVAQLLRHTGFPEREIPALVCTVKHESSFLTKAHNQNSDGSQDTGLFQINDIWLRACRVSRKELQDPMKNAKCALLVYARQGLKAWLGYTKKRECRTYQMAELD